MNFNRRFSDVLIPKSIKGLVNKYIGDFEHLKNISTVAYVNSLMIKGKKSNYRLHNTYNSNKFNTNDLLLKAFFRSFSDCVITSDCHIKKHKDNLEGVMIDFDNYGFFANAFKENTTRKDKRKVYYITSDNPTLSSYSKNDFYKADYIHKEFLIPDNKMSQITEDLKNKHNLNKHIDFNVLNNTDIINTVNYAISKNSGMVFIEGMGNKIINFLEEKNNKLNPIDMIVNCSVLYDNFDYSYKDYKAKVLQKQIKKAVKDNLNKESKENNPERENKIKQIGDLFISENFDLQYDRISHVSELDETLKGLVTIDVYKRKDLVVPIMDENLKKTMKIVKHTRELKNREKMRNLIRDN